MPITDFRKKASPDIRRPVRGSGARRGTAGGSAAAPPFFAQRIR
jgi:hypothetical protein